jgi:hypothetical protein
MKSTRQGRQSDPNGTIGDTFPVAMRAISKRRRDVFPATVQADGGRIELSTTFGRPFGDVIQCRSASREDHLRELRPDVKRIRNRG